MKNLTKTIKYLIYNWYFFIPTIILLFVFNCLTFIKIFNYDPKIIEDILTSPNQISITYGQITVILVTLIISTIIAILPQFLYYPINAGFIKSTVYFTKDKYPDDFKQELDKLQLSTFKKIFSLLKGGILKYLSLNFIEFGFNVLMSVLLAISYGFTVNMGQTNENGSVALSGAVLILFLLMIVIVILFIILKLAYVSMIKDDCNFKESIKNVILLIKKHFWQVLSQCLFFYIILFVLENIIPTQITGVVFLDSIVSAIITGILTFAQAVFFYFVYDSFKKEIVLPVEELPAETTDSQEKV